MAKPFIKSAGGKRLLAPFILDVMPKRCETYVEPFMGGGAIFFALDADHRIDSDVILGDMNTDLALLYETVRDQPENLLYETAQITHRCTGKPEAGFLRERELWNKGMRTPARQLYLRANCFNGIWRENKKGEFNVPWCKAPPRYVERDKIMAACTALRGVQILDWDFRRYEGGSVWIGEGTLVYVDPPYLGGWAGYTSDGWTEQDFVQLAELAETWTSRGAHVVLSHSDTPQARAILRKAWPSARIKTIEARRSINSDGNGRGPVLEIVASSMA